MQFDYADIYIKIKFAYANIKNYLENTQTHFLKYIRILFYRFLYIFLNDKSNESKKYFKYSYIFEKSIIKIFQIYQYQWSFIKDVLVTSLQFSCK